MPCRWGGLCRQGVSLYGSSVRGTWRGARCWGPRRLRKDGSMEGNLSIWGLCWVNLGWAHLLGLQDMAEGALEMVCLSPWELWKGTWRVFHLGTLKDIQKSLWTGISTQGLRFLGTQRRACISGTLRVERALGTGISSYRDSDRGTLSTGTLRVRRSGFVSMTPCVGNVVLMRKPQSTFCVSVRLQPHSCIPIWVPYFWTRRTYGNQAWGPSGTYLKEQGSYSLAQNMGHKGPVIKAYVHRARKGSNPNTILFYSKQKQFHNFWYPHHIPRL